MVVWQSSWKQLQLFLVFILMLNRYLFDKCRNYFIVVMLYVCEWKHACCSLFC